MTTVRIEVEDEGPIDVKFGAKTLSPHTVGEDVFVSVAPHPKENGVIYRNGRPYAILSAKKQPARKLYSGGNPTIAISELVERVGEPDAKWGGEVFYLQAHKAGLCQLAFQQ